MKSVFVYTLVGVVIGVATTLMSNPPTSKLPTCPDPWRVRSISIDGTKVICTYAAEPAGGSATRSIQIQ